MNNLKKIIALAALIATISAHTTKAMNSAGTASGRLELLKALNAKKELVTQASKLGTKEIPANLARKYQDAERVINKFAQTKDKQALKLISDENAAITKTVKGSKAALDAVELAAAKLPQSPATIGYASDITPLPMMPPVIPTTPITSSQTETVRLNLIGDIENLLINRPMKFADVKNWSEKINIKLQSLSAIDRPSAQAFQTRLDELKRTTPELNSDIQKNVSITESFVDTTTRKTPQSVIDRILLYYPTAQDLLQVKLPRQEMVDTQDYLLEQMEKETDSKKRKILQEKSDALDTAIRKADAVQYNISPLIPPTPKTQSKIQLSRKENPLWQGTSVKTPSNRIQAILNMNPTTDNFLKEKVTTQELGDAVHYLEQESLKEKNPSKYNAMRAQLNKIHPILLQGLGTIESTTSEESSQKKSTTPNIKLFDIPKSIASTEKAAKIEDLPRIPEKTHFVEKDLLQAEKDQPTTTIRANLLRGLENERTQEWKSVIGDLKNIKYYDEKNKKFTTNIIYKLIHAAPKLDVNNTFTLFIKDVPQPSLMNAFQYQDVLNKLYAEIKELKQ